MEIISKEEEQFLDWVINSVEGKLVCFDVGANKGFYSSALLEKLGDKIDKINCFEPVQENYDQCTSKFGDNEKVNLFLNACSNEKVVKKFYQIISKNIGCEGLSSLNYRPVFNNLQKKEIQVDCIVLDDFIDINPDDSFFFKIDVEGHELEVMEGMVKYFGSNQIECLQFEYGDCMLEQGKNLKDIQEFLNQFEDYCICDFSGEFVKIDESNIENYISNSWSNLYIIKNKYV
jgi:FkbM family methyltransferase